MFTFPACNVFAFHSMNFSSYNYGIWLNQLHTTQQSAHWRHEFALTARCTFTAIKSAPKGNTVAKRRNRKRERRKTTCSPVPSRVPDVVEEPRSRPARFYLSATARFSASCETGSSSLCDLETHKLRTAQTLHVREHRWERPISNTNIP